MITGNTDLDLPEVMTAEIVSRLKAGTICKVRWPNGMVDAAVKVFATPCSDNEVLLSFPPNLSSVRLWVEWRNDFIVIQVFGLMISSKFNPADPATDIDGIIEEVVGSIFGAAIKTRKEYEEFRTKEWETIPAHIRSQLILGDGK